MDAGVSPADAESFTSGLVSHLLRFHNAKDSAVRFRVCQIVAAVFNTLDEDAEIDISEMIQAKTIGDLVDVIDAARARATDNGI